jgi:hypothetical protein
MVSAGDTRLCVTAISVAERGQVRVVCLDERVAAHAGDLKDFGVERGPDEGAGIEVPVLA